MDLQKTPGGTCGLDPKTVLAGMRDGHIKAVISQMRKLRPVAGRDNLRSLRCNS